MLTQNPSLEPIIEDMVDLGIDQLAGNTSAEDIPKLPKTAGTE